MNQQPFYVYVLFRYRDTDWFVRVGDNFMASRDPSEQTFQVNYSTLDLESEGIMDFFNVKIGSSCKITSTQS